jgi:hypothetical protein
MRLAASLHDTMGHSTCGVVRVAQQDPVGRVLEQNAEAFLAFTQGVLGSLALGDVAEIPDTPVISSVGAGDGRAVTVENAAIVQKYLLTARLVPMFVEICDFF